MSGYRWIPIVILAPSVLSGCQTDSGSRFAWNPFRREQSQLADTENESAFSWSRFRDGREKRDDPQPIAERPLMAEEQVDRLLEQGQIALQENRLEDATKAYREVLAAAPDNATAHHGLAMVSDLSQQWSDAEYHYRQALRIRPKDANLLCDIGYSYLLQHRYSESARYLNHAVEVNPSHENARMNLALLDLKQGNRASAEQRIQAWYGASGRTQQIMAQLERQVGEMTSAPTGVIPANATLEQVQELARRERLEAEQDRVARMVSAGQDSVRETANAAMATTTEQLYSAGFPQPDGQPGSAPGANSGFTANGAMAGSANGAASRVTGSAPSVTPAVVSAVSGTGTPLSGGAPWSQQGPGMNAGPMNPPVWANAPNPAAQSAVGSNSSSGANVNHLPHAPYGVPDPRFGSPAAVSAPAIAQNPAPMTPGLVNGMPGSPSIPSTGLPGASSGGPMPPAQVPGYAHGSNSGHPASAATGNLQAPRTDAAGRVIPVHSSGNYSQPPAASASYGQPLGFGSGSVGLPAPGAVPMQAASYGTPVNPGTLAQTPVASAGDVRGQAPSAQQMPMDALNVGPGALFPISPPGATPVGPATSTLPAAGPTGAASGPADNSVRMGTVSSPGSNALINGSLYGQPTTQLPAEEALRQAQEQFRLRQQNSGVLNSPPGTPGATAWPAARPQPVNPLESYDRQRQQLDNEYNRALQQLDYQNPARIPTAQY